jgi:ABC-type sugar transport system ATPase subunit
MTVKKGRLSLTKLRKWYGAFEALKGVDLDIEPQEFFALLGPSGSGKTTTLRVIAGLETIDEGALVLDDADVTDASPAERNIAMVFQNYALYPHMTVAENIGFPLRMEKVPKAEISRLVREAARRLKIDHLLDRRPGQLSGGQQQRCALARAVVRKPRLFLLDEPLSNLDAQLRLETRIELKRLHSSLGVTTIYVTHDQEEAMTLADRIAVFSDGRIIQVGTPDEVFDYPESTEVAGFIGSPPMNLVPATIRSGRLRIGDYEINLPNGELPSDGEVVLGIRPSHVGLSDSGLAVRLLLSENLGESMLLNVDADGHLIKVRLPVVRHLAIGTTLHLTFDPAYIHLFDPQSHRRIGGKMRA